MKSYKISIYALLLAGIGLWSCNNDDMEQAVGTLPGGSGETVDITFSATMGGTLSKSTVSATTGETQFSSDDCIKVFADGTNAKFTCAGVSDDGTEAQFSGTIKKTNGYYAMLPYQDNATASGNTLTMTIPADQKSKYEELMVGYVDNEAQAFQFKHVGAMIRFNTQKKFSSIEIEDAKGNKIAGDVSVKIGADGKITEVSGGTSTKVSVTRDIEKAEYVLITIKPGTYEPNELKIKFTDKTQGYWFTHIIDKQVTLKSGVIYSYGNVGKWLVTCVDPQTSNVLFKLYAPDYDTDDGEVRGKLMLPQVQAEAGYVYGYHTKANATSAKYTTTIGNISADLTIYPVKVAGIKITVYTSGADGTPTEIYAHPNSDATLPAITMPVKEGCAYGYAKQPNGNPVATSGGSVHVITSPLTYYAVEIPAYQAIIYTDVNSTTPAQTISGIGGFSFTLPNLPKKSGYFAGYNTVANEQDLRYYQGQTLTYDPYIFGQTKTFYPVYFELVDVTKTNDVSLPGVTVGQSDLSTTEALTDIITKVDKGTCSVFKFTNHCNASANQDKNFVVYLLDSDNPNTLNCKELSSNIAKYGQSELHLSNGDYMSNINNTEVTVKVYNKGGMADVEISWTGTNDGFDNYAKFQNISIWNNLYVTFGVNNSYIELK